MKKRMVSLLLALCMLLTLAPAAFAADTHITVSADAPTTAEIRAGDTYTLLLPQIFSDADGHAMTYTLADNFENQAVIAEDGTLTFSTKTAGTYALHVTAACKEDASVTAMHAVTVTVKPASHITVSASAPATVETKVGEAYTLNLATVFTDANGHGMTYALAENYGAQVYIKSDGTLVFTAAASGAQAVTIIATCKSDSTVMASYTITFDVEAVPDGDPSQYDYEETPAASVTVYVTISSDGIPLIGNDSAGTVLAHVPVMVPYFDLADYDLGNFYRYGTKNGSGTYANTTVVERPTLLHLYLYLLQRYYLGLDPQDCTADNNPSGAAGNQGVNNMLGQQAYNDTNKALNITGSPTSLYMEQFWGHDQNLMYYRNHVYPLMNAGFGATADYILLSDGDTVDLAMFTDWGFYTTGYFARFDQDEYLVAAGQPLTVQTQKYDTQSVSGGGSERFETVSGLNVEVYDANWNQVDAVTENTGGNGTFTYTFPKAGTYYLLSTSANAGTSNANAAPATARVVVTQTGVAATGITVTPEMLKLDVGETGSLTAAVLPKNASNQKVTWCSADESVATVNENGLVTGVAAGTAAITAATADGGFTASCAVTVTEPIAYGDINGNGTVTAVDAALVYAAVNGAKTLTAKQVAAADVNGNGTVTAADAALIYAKVNGRLTEFPAEKN
ncbi:MAG: Ig-like domain-containing protein [Oscillospiraceae bacterium]|nr:Ig-like domain-containing protein [Oscillospiraceae bacterium]